jgi:hypothetical protein
VLLIAADGVLAQAPPPAPDVPNPPPIIGRDLAEPGEVVGKSFLLKVWLSDVGGPGIQRIYSVRVGADGNITVPGSAPQHAEGLAISALEVQVAAPYKVASPNAKAWISIIDRNPPAPPPATAPAPPPAPAPAPTPAPAAAPPPPAAAAAPPSPAPSPAATPTSTTKPAQVAAAAAPPATGPTTKPVK